VPSRYIHCCPCSQWCFDSLALMKPVNETVFLSPLVPFKLNCAVMSTKPTQTGNMYLILMMPKILIGPSAFIILNGQTEHPKQPSIAEAIYHANFNRQLMSVFVESSSNWIRWPCFETKIDPRQWANVLNPQGMTLQTKWFFLVPHEIKTWFRCCREIENDWQRQLMGY